MSIIKSVIKLIYQMMVLLMLSIWIRIGRKSTIQLTAVAFTVGSLVMAFSDNLAVLLVGRWLFFSLLVHFFIVTIEDYATIQICYLIFCLICFRFVVGFAVSLSAMSECLYISEISAPSNRGTIDPTYAR